MACVTSGEAMAPLAQKELVMARPANSVGRSGRQIELQCNFFKMDIRGLDAIYQYDVALYAERRPRGAPKDSRPEVKDVAADQPVVVNRNIFRRFTKAKGIGGRQAIAYDGRKIAFSAAEISDDADGFRLACDREGNEVAPDSARVEWVTVHFVMSGAMDSNTIRQVLGGKISAMGEGVQPVVNALDVVLSEGNSLRYVEVGRTFYSDARAVDLGGGAQAWRGFYQSIRLTNSGLAVNVEESFTPFYMKGTLYDVCAKANGGRLPGNFRDWRRLGKDLHSLRVRARHTKMTYRLFGFSDKGADQTMFKDDSNQQISVATYMQKTYGIRLQNASLPCVRTNPRRDIFVPLELLEVCENQRRTKAMTPQQTAQMIRTAALKPDVRQQSAQKSIETANYNKDATCNAFGMQVNPQMMKVKARILEVPRLEYRGNKTMQPRDGSWNMAANAMHFGVGIFHWVVIQIGNYMRKDGPQGVNNLIQEMVNIGTQNGVTFGAQEPPQYNVDPRISPGAYEKYLIDLIDRRNREIRAVRGQENHHLQLVVILKEKQDTPIYNTTKRVCDILKGVASQCLLSSTIVKQRRLDQYVSNVLLKINAKLGGHNVKVQPATNSNLNPKFLNRPHIVMGADVTHPAPGSGGRPSVAAVVGSYDRHSIQFSGALRNQPSRQEIIGDMSGMFLEVYRRWFNHFRNPQTGVGVHAESIIMFRDGVSEGQYQQVMDVELPAIRRACREKCGINPLISYIIVTKRHHTRFFGTNKTSPRDLDRIKNIVAGTVIDTDVTSSTLWDFYVNSHQGIQGTNRPSKYTVLIDENKMSADQLQNYIFRLSHGYARCTRSVSMVNAAYYAHLLAFRGRCFLGDEGSDDMSMSSGGVEVVPPTEQLHPSLANNLFFI